MKNITSASNLVFYKVEKFEFNRHNTFDVLNCPRPHFCMGLMLSGTGYFYEDKNKEPIVIKPGDIIFVPITSRYLSEWEGNPEISYISMHFIFDYTSVYSGKKNFCLQKISGLDFAETKKVFEFALSHYQGNEAEQLAVLGCFYQLLARILPMLKCKKQKIIDERIHDAITYIEQHYREEITVEELSRICNMSVSHFFPCFKKAVGVTPVEYINHHRIGQAIILLMNDEKATISNISELVGFESDAYFRRVFKRVTGKTPREYRNTASAL
ncbi:MAG: helix-turn-helix transcriptional regulator [Ruminococcaceae bacterium]|nr:helix-turn-helix transcriptional regulator [Oscillospiraceae bacterium]